MTLRATRCIVLPLLLAMLPALAAPALAAPALAAPALAKPAVAAPALLTQVEQAARAALEQHTADAAVADAEFALTVVPPRNAPLCNGPVEVDAIDTRQPARMRFAVRCAGQPGRGQEYIVRARITAPVVVAAVALPANVALDASQLRLERRDITAMADALAAPQDAIGQTSRRSLRAGDVLRAASLAAPLLVKRGDAVTMVARHDGVEVSTVGEALEAGARGAIIRVRNGASGQTVRMRVTAPGTVEPSEMPRISP